MKGGKLVRHTVSPQQAEILRLAISNYPSARKLMLAWRDATERAIAVENLAGVPNNFARRLRNYGESPPPTKFAQVSLAPQV